LLLKSLDKEKNYADKALMATGAATTPFDANPLHLPLTSCQAPPKATFIDSTKPLLSPSLCNFDEPVLGESDYLISSRHAVEPHLPPELERIGKSFFDWEKEIWKKVLRLQ